MDNIFVRATGKTAGGTATILAGRVRVTVAQFPTLVPNSMGGTGHALGGVQCYARGVLGFREIGSYGHQSWCTDRDKRALSDAVSFAALRCTVRVQCARKQFAPLAVGRVGDGLLRANGGRHRPHIRRQHAYGCGRLNGGVADPVRCFCHELFGLTLFSRGSSYTKILIKRRTSSGPISRRPHAAAPWDQDWWIEQRSARRMPCAAISGARHVPQ